MSRFVPRGVHPSRRALQCVPVWKGRSLKLSLLAEEKCRSDWESSIRWLCNERISYSGQRQSMSSTSGDGSDCHEPKNCFTWLEFHGCSGAKGSCQSPTVKYAVPRYHGTILFLEALKSQKTRVGRIKGIRISLYLPYPALTTVEQQIRSGASRVNVSCARQRVCPPCRRAQAHRYRNRSETYVRTSKLI